MSHGLILIRGGGDLASGVAYRLFRAGLKVVLVETQRPTVVRRTVSFAQAAYDDITEVEGITCQKVSYEETTNLDTTYKDADAVDLDSVYDNSIYGEVYQVIDRGRIPLLIDPELKSLAGLKPDVLIEATMSKKNTGINKDMAKTVIALGPGYKAGEDVDCVIETARGHYLGRVIYEGEAEPNTGVPGNIDGYTTERLLRAPCKGEFRSKLIIGDIVKEGEIVGYVDDTPVEAGIDGMIRGLLQNGLRVKENMKLGDIDPRKNIDHCYTISDKALAVAGGALEAILTNLK